MDCLHYKTSDPNQYANNNTLENIDEHGGIHETWNKVSKRRSFTSGDGSSKKLERKKSQVLFEGYVETSSSSSSSCDNQEDLKRSKSLTDDDLEDLKGCLDLGFGFSYNEIPELCNTLPALELCYSMSQKFLDHKSVESSSVDDSSSSSSHSPAPIANWKISSPGDNPDDVKARLKYWAQAVACTVQLCS